MVHLLTTKEIAEQLRLPNRSVCKLAQEGKIPSAFKVGKHWRFRKDTILQWIEESSVQNIREWKAE